MPKDNDTELSKIPASVLGTVRPLSTAWRHLVEGGVEQDPEMVVQASEVMSMIQCTLCLLGNSVELISESRRGKILEAIDPSWVKYKEFQKSLTKKVEDDSALAPSSIHDQAKEGEREDNTGPQKGREKEQQFFRGGPPAKYGGRQGKSFFPYNTSFRDNNANRPRQFQNYQRQRPKPLFHEPRPPTKAKPENPTEKALELLCSSRNWVWKWIWTISAEDGQQTSRRKAPVLCGELGENHRRSLGKRDCYRCSSGISQHASPRKSPGEVHLSVQQSVALTEEVRKLQEKQAITPASAEGGFTSTVFLVPKGRWLMATSDKSPKP